HGIIDHWLQPIRDIADAYREDLERIADRQSRLDRLCEMNIRAQVEGLSRTPILRSAWDRGKELHIHGWVYGLDNGLIRDLKCSRWPVRGGLRGGWARPAEQAREPRLS